VIDWLLSHGAEADIVANLLPLLIAYLLALPIGGDREQHERSAGLRTFPLVAMTSCGFIEATETVTTGNPEATARNRLIRRNAVARLTSSSAASSAISPEVTSPDRHFRNPRMASARRHASSQSVLPISSGN